jgi:hypothetical protein
MYRHPQCILLAASLAAFSASSALGAPLCLPQLTVKDVQFSEIRNMRRTWTADLNVDAASCAATTGRFYLRFVRAKENAPDLEFAEQLSWQAGPMQVSIEFWQDEAVQDYAIGYVAPCACRDSLNTNLMNSNR